MNIFQLHFYAIKRALSLLTLGQFLKFCIPGAIISVFFYLFLGGLNYTNNALSFIEKTPWIGTFLKTSFNYTLSWIENLSLFIYQFTIITLLSPVNTILSQRVEMKETGKTFDISFSKIIRDFIRLIGIVFVWAILYAGLYLIWLLLAKLFGMSFLNPYISLIIIAFFTGFNFYDHSLERHNISIGRSWKYAFKHSLNMIAVGLIFTAILTIPFAGIVLAPIFSTIVATVVFFKEKELTA